MEQKRERLTLSRHLGAAASTQNLASGSIRAEELPTEPYLDEKLIFRSFQLERGPGQRL
jgi:hypothetical protein